MYQDDSTCKWSEALSGSSPATSSLTPWFFGLYTCKSMFKNNANTTKRKCADTQSVICRKGRTPYHEISTLTGKEKFYCWDWVKFWKYHHTPQQAVSWWIAWCFLFGSVLFLMGACTSLSHKVNSSHRCRHFFAVWAYVILLPRLTFVPLRPMESQQTTSKKFE